MNLPLGLGLLLTLLVGMAIGLIKLASTLSILGLPPFIATLAMMMVARGLALIIFEQVFHRDREHRLQGHRRRQGDPGRSQRPS